MKFENIVTESKNNLYSLVARELSKNYFKSAITVYDDRLSFGYSYDNEEIIVNVYLNEINDLVEIVLDKIIINIENNEAKNTNYSINLDNNTSKRRKVTNDVSLIAKTTAELVENEINWLFDTLDDFIKEITKSAKNLEGAVVLK